MDTVTDICTSFEFNKVATESIGTFEMEVDNNDGNLTDKYVGGETVELVMDAGSSTTTRFKGTVEEVRKKYGGMGNILVVKGTHVSGKLLDITVTKTYTGQTPDFILKDLIDNYATDFTKTNILASTDTIDISFNHRPFWDAVIDLATAADFDVYVDDNKDFRFFPRGSIFNQIEAIVQDDNFRDMEGLLEDTLDVKNRIIVYGKSKDGLPIVYRTDDTASQSRLNIKERIITDSSANTYQKAKDRGDAELFKLNLAQTKGEVTSLGLPDLNPGDLMWISIPMHGIHRRYIVTKFAHSYGDEGLQTKVTVQKESSQIPQILKKQFIKDVEQEATDNPNELQFSYVLEFDDTSEVDIFQNTALSEGSLVLAAGNTTGTMTSAIRTHTSSITKTELRISGQDLDSSVFEISADGGAAYQTVTRNTLNTMTSPGTKLIVRVTLNSDTNNPFPKADSCAILYR